MYNSKNSKLFSRILCLFIVLSLFFVISINCLASDDIELYPMTYTISATDFGAVPNDTVADNDAIQRALDSLSETGGTVYLPAGTYKLYKWLDIPSSVELCGEEGKTILQAATSIPFLIRSHGYEDFVVNKNAQWSDTSNVPQDFAIKNIVLDGKNLVENGINLYGYDFRLYNVTIRNFTGVGLLEHWAEDKIDTWKDNESKFFESHIVNLAIEDCPIGIDWHELTDAYFNTVNINNCDVGMIVDANIYLSNLNIEQCTVGLQLNTQSYVSNINVQNSNIGMIANGWHANIETCSFRNNSGTDIVFTKNAKYTLVRELQSVIGNEPHTAIDDYADYTSFGKIVITGDTKQNNNYSPISLSGYHTTILDATLENFNTDGGYIQELIRIPQNKSDIIVSAKAVNSNRPLYSETNKNEGLNDLRQIYNGNSLTEYFENEISVKSIHESNLNDTITVEASDFGAVGDLKTNDTNAIQKAINSLKTTGGTVHLSPGTYRITKPLTLYSGITLSGDGAQATTIYLGDNANCAMLQTEVGTTGFAIQNVGFFGNKYNGHNTDSNGLIIRGANFRIENVWVDAASGNGVEIITDNATVNSYINNLNIKYCDKSGIVYSGANCVYTDNLTVSECGLYGLEVQTKATFNYMHLYANHGAYQYIDRKGACVNQLISESAYGTAVLLEGDSAKINTLQVYSNRNVDLNISTSAKNTQIGTLQYKGSNELANMQDDGINTSIWVYIANGIIQLDKMDIVEEITKPEEPVDTTLYGDVNHDGYVDSDDVLLILRVFAGLTAPDKIDTKAGDVNQDGKIDSDDAMLVLRYYAGIISKLPIDS